MKYSLDQSVEEVARRGEHLRRRKDKRIGNVLFSGAGTLMAVLVAVIYTYTEPTVPDQGTSAYGSFLLSQDAGGYVITAIMAFTLGVALTLVVLFRRRRIRH